ncbi:helix-turn-helix domain-containing protein [Gluconobacter sp.]|uniref:helix-turn-helix domain-containing protein n=1 Tax=Gluconobacter sp. TaxID=1876758 RepID=UPI0039EA3E7E
MDLKEVMAVNLRRMRHDRDMTQEELADRAGLVSASVTILGKIAEALDVEPGALLKAVLASPR